MAEAQGARDAAQAALAAWGVQAVPDVALADAAEPEPAVPDATAAAAQHPCGSRLAGLRPKWPAAPPTWPPCRPVPTPS